MAGMVNKKESTSHFPCCSRQLPDSDYGIIAHPVVESSPSGGSERNDTSYYHQPISYFLLRVYDITMEVEIVLKGTLQNWISLRYVTTGAGLPQKPKRPLGKYMIFSQEKHPQVRAKNPDLSFTETAKEIARLWRELPDEERESYTAQAKQYMENYNEEIAVFKASLTEEDVKMIAQHKQQKKLMNVNKKNKQELTKLERPKRPLTAYGIFVQSKLSGISGNITNKMVAVGGEWKQMSEDEKSDYYTLASKARRDYHLAMDGWETKMADEGNISVVRKKSQHLERYRNKTEASKKSSKYEEEPF